MNNKKGFTLVELLAVITIIVFLLLIVSPKIINTINNSRNKGYYEIEIRIKEAASKYIATEYIDSNIDSITISKNQLIDSGYIGEIYDLKDDSICDAFVIVDNLKELANFKVILDCSSYTSSGAFVYLTVNLNGGVTTQQFEEKYFQGTEIILEEPIKDKSEFVEYIVLKGNSTIEGNKLTIGSEDTIIHAVYESYPTFKVELDGGIDNAHYDEIYKSGTVIELEEPTKENYKFTGWKVTKGNSIVSGNKVTIGDSDTILTATWELNVFNLSVELNGGSINQNPSGDYAVGSTITLEMPTKEGYTFTGWSVSGTGALLSGSNLTIGSSDVTLTATWEVNTYEITYNSGNLIYNLDDKYIVDTRMTYSVSNKVVTVTAAQDDGYGFINARVYLEANKTYIFNCNSSGIWGTVTGTDTVEAFLMLNGQYDAYYHMKSNKDFTFTPTVTGTYWLRLDVNQNGKTYTFSNINISTTLGEKTVAYGSTYGELLNPTRTGYDFLGWYTGVAAKDSSKAYKDYPFLYYSDYHGDLYNAYGYNEIDLKNHYYNNGISEGRRISEYVSTDVFKSLNNITIYAGWSAKTYNISYNLNGGTNASGNPTNGILGSTVIVSNPSRTGYTFTGWSVSGTGALLSGTNLTIGSSNITLTANWKLNTYTVSFNANGGDLNTTYNISGEHIYNVSKSGVYQLEVWGAQGGKVKTNEPGYGGYSTGFIWLGKGTNLYVNVGGKGTDDCKASSTGSLKTFAGGYNGGGVAYSSDASRYVGSGGGATHIATVSGQLQNLSGYAGNHNSPILIVAGGGGGSGYYSYSAYGTWYGYGGAGGGVSGNAGIVTGTEAEQGYPGTQTSGYAFGLGESSPTSSKNQAAAGGGGGYYGGGAGFTYAGGAGGGSGYIANNSLYNKFMYCYNCTTSSNGPELTYSTTNYSTDPISNYAKLGDGAARIIPESSITVSHNSTYGEMLLPTRSEYRFVGWNTQSTGAGTYVTETSTIVTNSNHSLYAIWKPNLLYGLDDVSSKTNNNIKYSIANKVVTVQNTSSSHEGNGYTTGRVDLEANKTYVFSCDSSGTWGTEMGTDTVEAFLMLNGKTTTYYHMVTNKNYVFTPAVTGTYWLRLDVNGYKNTHSFANIYVTEY